MKLIHSDSQSAGSAQTGSVASKKATNGDKLINELARPVISEVGYETKFPFHLAGWNVRSQEIRQDVHLLLIGCRLKVHLDVYLPRLNLMGNTEAAASMPFFSGKPTMDLASV